MNERSLTVDNEIVFHVFVEINEGLDEYFTRMSAVHTDFVPHVSFYFKNYISGLVKRTEDFLHEEETLHVMSDASSYSMKDIVALFRRYSRSMREIFVQEDMNIVEIFDSEDEAANVGEVVDVINKTFLILMMEKLLTVVSIMIEEAAGVMPQNKIDSVFDEIVAENWG